MDGTQLDQAYTAAKNADAATMAGDYSKAGNLYEEASELFAKVAATSPSHPAVRILNALADQHKQRAKYLASGKARVDARKLAQTASANTSASAIAGNAGTAGTAGTAGNAGNAGNAGSAGSGPPSAGGALASQLSAARAPPHFNGISSVINMPPNMAGTQPAPPLPQSSTPAMPGAYPNSGSGSSSSSSSTVLGEDSVTTILSKANAAYSKAYEQALVAARGDPSESFYLVADRSNDVNADLGARVHAFEAASRAQKQAMKKGLQQLHRELSGREQRLVDEHIQEVDRLRAENDRLKIQVTKYKGRWDDLKESARKRSSK